MRGLYDDLPSTGAIVEPYIPSMLAAVSLYLTIEP